jgi:hypothetical protein
MERSHASLSQQCVSCQQSQDRFIEAFDATAGVQPFGETGGHIRVSPETDFEHEVSTGDWLQHSSKECW